MFFPKEEVKLWLYYCFNYFFFSTLVFLYDVSDIPYFKKDNISKIQKIKMFKKAINNICFNLTVLTFPIHLVMTDLFVDIDKPNKEGFIFNLVATILMGEFLFYFIHRLFHIQFLYKFHRVHHEYKETNGISALYTHPLDYIFGNFIPFTFSIIYLNPPLYQIYLTLTLFLFNTIVLAHSNYTLGDNFHKLHHKFLKCNFGATSLLDRVLGTHRPDN